jgi:hypothetical protein
LAISELEIALKALDLYIPDIRSIEEALIRQLDRTNKDRRQAKLPDEVEQAKPWD